MVALKDCIRSAQSVIEWARNRGEISGDEIVCAQTLVYDQFQTFLNFANIDYLTWLRRIWQLRIPWKF